MKKKYLKSAFEFYMWVCTAIISGFLISFILGGGDININKYHFRHDGAIKYILNKNQIK